MIFGDLPVAVDAALFGGAALAVWRAGQRLAGAADELASRTQLRTALLGALLLGAVTSLPEAAGMVTASAIGRAPLATGNLFGSMSANIVILAMADFAFRQPVAAVADRGSTVRQGAVVLLLLTAAGLAIVVDDPIDARVGASSVALFLLVVAVFAVLRRVGRHEEAVRPPPMPGKEGGGVGVLGGRIGVIALAVVVAGFTASVSADALATELGLDAGFVGFVLLAGATSLPEVSTTIGSARLGNADLAVGNIFGTNVFNMSLVLAADVGYRRGPVLDAVPLSTVVSVAVAAAVVAGYLVGGRWPKVTIARRLGLGSLLALLAYIVGLPVVFAVQ